MFFSNMIVQGINNAFGEIIYTIVSEFNSDLASVALVPSIHSSAYYFAGFICSVLVKWYSFRSLVFVGGVVSCLAFVASFYSPNLLTLTLAYGLLGGMGTGIVYTPGLIACGFYFDESKRALATGIATSGSGVGLVVIPLAVNYINEKFGWRSSMLFLSSISPIIFFVALVMVPVPTEYQCLQTVTGETSEYSSLTYSNLYMSKYSSLDQHIEEVENDHNGNGIQTIDLKDNEKEIGNIKKDHRFHAINLIRQIKQFFTHYWNVLKQPKLLAYCFSHGLFTLGYFIPIDFLKDMMVEDHNISTKKAGTLVPIIGAATCLGNLLTGLLITKFKLNALFLTVLYLLGCGICCVIFTFCTQYSGFVGVAVLYGLILGPIDMMILECLTKMFGMQLVKDTIGFVMLVYAMGAIIGAPVGGWLYDRYDVIGFNEVFYIDAMIYLLAALCGWAALFLNKKQ